MASTKQRQALAKLRRKAAALNDEINSTSTAITSQLASVVSDVTFEQVAGNNDIYDMLCDFGRDYWAAGDKCFRDGVPAKLDKFSEARSGYEIYYKNQSAGFITFEEHTDIWSGQTRQTIDLVYVRPEFRGLGIAALAYRWGIRTVGASGISLAYHRIHGRVAYWRAVGFTHIANLPGNQFGTKNTLFYLIVPGVNAHLRQLSDWDLKAAKESLAKNASRLMKTGLYDYA